MARYMLLSPKNLFNNYLSNFVALVQPENILSICNE